MNSYWNNSNKNIRKKFNTLKDDMVTDICIIGGGITGISIGYELNKRNKDFIILEKDIIANKTTGCTTAKITSQHGLIYDYLINSFGKNFANNYLLANETAIKNIKNIIDKENIDCDFKIDSSYVYTSDKNNVQKIKNEASALNLLNHNFEYLTDIPLPLDILCGIKFYNQANFNPLKYVYGLIKTFYKNNIFEHSLVTKIKYKNGKYEIFANNKIVKCNNLILATKYPIKDIPGFYFLKLYQETSYAICIKTNGKKFDGMYINVDIPKLSFRWINDDTLIIGGNNHKTGDNVNTLDMYKYLEDIAKKIYPNCKILHKWNSEDTISLDKLPYIGKFSNILPNLYVATGFNKWGMTSSNIVANIVCDKIENKKNKFEDIFNSTRFKPIKNIKELNNMIKESVYSLFINKIKIRFKNNKENNNLNGFIIKEGNKLIGISRDEKGNIYKIKPICTHLGCLLNYNHLDNTWDCPCHGSKYNFDGKLIYGPSCKDLEIYKV